jgi:hypothetical protein
VLILASEFVLESDRSTNTGFGMNYDTHCVGFEATAATEVFANHDVEFIARHGLELDV